MQQRIRGEVADHVLFISECDSEGIIKIVGQFPKLLQIQKACLGVFMIHNLVIMTPRFDSDN